MPQGKFKSKIKLPDSIKIKKKKGLAISKRGNAPIPPKKNKNVQVQKLKQMITKTVNATAEEQLRSIALGNAKSMLSKSVGSKSKSSASIKK